MGSRDMSLSKLDVSASLMDAIINMIYLSVCNNDDYSDGDNGGDDNDDGGDDDDVNNNFVRQGTPLPDR